MKQTYVSIHHMTRQNMGPLVEYILTPDGRQMGRLDFLFKDSQQIREAQLIQDDLSHVTVKIARTAAYSDRDQARLMRDLRAYLGDEIRLDIEYVEAIPRGANGKFRQIVSSVFPQHTAAPPSATGKVEQEVLP